MNIKKSFRIALAMKGATQADMAAVVGVTPATLSLILNRESIPSERIKQLADAFGMKVSEFVAMGEE